MEEGSTSSFFTHCKKKSAGVPDSHAGKTPIFIKLCVKQQPHASLSFQHSSLSYKSLWLYLYCTLTGTFWKKSLQFLKKRFLLWCIFSLVLFGPCIVDVINSSLMSGCVRTAFRHAVVQPLHQKDEFDFSIPSNFKPISKFPFLSKKKRKEQKNQLVTNYSSSSI